MTAARPGAPIDPAALPADGFWVKTARVLRMTAVRLSILYFVVFTVFSVFLVVLVCVMGAVHIVQWIERES